MGAAPILTILKNGETIRSLPVETEADLGRAEGCVIRLDDRAISRYHAIFKRKGDSLQVEKKSEFAPLMVNGQDCTKALLKEGDVISIGPYLVKVKADSAQEPPVPALEPPDAVGLPLTTPPVAATPNLASGASSAASPLEAGPGIALPSVLEVANNASPNLSGGAEAQAGASEVAGENLALSSAVEAAASVPLEAAAPGPSDDAKLDIEASSGADRVQTEEGSIEIPHVGDPLSGEAPRAAEMDFTQVMGDRSAEMKLVFPPGAANYTEFTIKKKETSLGRGNDCDIILNDKKCSRKNTIIIKEGLDVRIKDLGSVNGTYVNGQKINGEVELSAGDKIRVGDVDFVYNADQKGYAQKDYLPVESIPEVTSTFPVGSQSADMGAPVLEVSGENPEAIAGIPPTPGVAESNTQGISQIAGIGDELNRQKGLMDKFRALPKRRQYIVIFLVIALGYFFLFDDDTVQQKKKVVKPKSAQSQQAKTDADAKGAAGKKDNHAFDALTKEQQNFIRTQHRLAFEYYQSKDYDNALFEIQKIFKYVDDFEDSREIEQYAREGKRFLELKVEEKRKKDDEEARVKKLQGLIATGRAKMEAKKYNEVPDLFAEILTMDPENAQVATWQAKIKEYEEDLRIQAQKKRVQEEVNQEAWKVLNSGIALRKQGQYHEAIETLRKVKEVGASDTQPKIRASAEIKGIHEEIKSKLEPLIQDGKDKENAGDYTNAIAAYTKVFSFESENPTATQAIARIKTILNDRAKALYTEAVLAESYSDFATAKRKFKECLDSSPSDSPYHDKSERKLSRYFKQPGVVDDSTPPSMNSDVGNGGTQ